MSEKKADLSEIATATISDFLSGDNAAILTAFVLVTEAVDADGDTVTRMTYLDGQTPQRSAGLVAWADEWTRDDMRRQFYAACDCPDEDD